MQIQLFTIPIPGGESQTEEMNKFLRSKRVLQVDQYLVTTQGGGYLCFTIRYAEDTSPYLKTKEKVDYRLVLSEEEFARFAKMRSTRLKIAKEEDTPAFAIMTDEELAALARLPRFTEKDMAAIPGVGEKKAAKYASFFMEAIAEGKADEASK